MFQRLETTVLSVAWELVRKALPISAEVPSNLRVALEIFLELHSRQSERGQLVSEDYARGIQTFKHLFAQYGHQAVTNDLPELPQGSGSNATDETNITASGSSHSLTPERNLPNELETQAEGHQENLSTDMLPDEPMTDDNFTLSGAATPAQDEPDTGISQMEAADIELELNNLLTIDDSDPSPIMVADPVMNSQPAATVSMQDLPTDQPDERKPFEATHQNPVTNCS